MNVGQEILEGAMWKCFAAKATYEPLLSAVIKYLITFHAEKGVTLYYLHQDTPKNSQGVSGKSGLLANVGVESMTENVLSSVEEFICRLYGVTQTTSVDAARHIFSRRGKPLSFHGKRSHYP